MEAKARVLELARAEGFATVRVARAEPLRKAFTAARAAWEEGRLADMAWMTPEWLARATDPETFLAGAKSVIVAGLPCHSPEPDPPADSPPGARGRVARYAWGRDYHRTFEKRLRRLARAIREEFGADARATVDYGPLLERPFALAAGMGWLGKSTMLLVPGFGPWMLLGAVATTLELEPDPRIGKTCGACVRCIVACPTGAISPDGRIDSRLCISYHTIENRGPIPRGLRAKFGSWVFGCDECLEGCPVGTHRFESHPDFLPPTYDHAYPRLAELIGLDDEEFRRRFQGRPLMRAKRDGLVRNACVALGNVGLPEDVPALIRALEDRSPLVRGHAAWALGRCIERFADSVAPAADEARAALEARAPLETDPWVREEIALALTVSAPAPAASAGPGGGPHVG
ncbi:Epoxyqueuosine reductase [bacterium HR29]|jgi:epoxyqueuosine reductase|nr:Epoxyqueuosine reductase [bacterium HR29]